MPLITIKTSTVLSDSSKNRLAESLSLATEKILKKDRKLIVILFEFADLLTSWFVGGVVKGAEDNIFVIKIFITEGTNTDVEKAEWISEVWDRATEVLGSTTHPNYISVCEIHGANWGYNGLSQKQRMIQST